MARGRMIVNEITRDKRIHDLSNDTSRLAFTWLVTFTDQKGRVFGDPALIRSTLFPRRDDMTIEQITDYIEEWHAAGLIVWYEAGGDRWIFFPAFKRHQVGFDKRHEPDSVRPAPPGPQDNVPGSSTAVARTRPVQCTAEEKRREEKRREVKESPTGADAPPTDSQAMFTALAEISGIDWRVCTDSQRGALNQSEKRLRKAGATVDEMHRFADWWSAHDWRGKKGERPTPAQIREEWGKFKAWRAEQPTGVPPPMKERAPPTPQQLLWHKALSELQAQTSKATFHTALSGTRINGNDNGTVRVLACNEIQLDWLTQRMHDSVLKVLRGIDDSISEVAFEVEG